MDKYYLVNVRDNLKEIRIDVTVQPLIDVEKIPDITYVYDPGDSDSTEKSLVFCQLKGFLTEESAMEYFRSIDRGSEKILLFYPFKSAFYKMFEYD